MVTDHIFFVNHMGAFCCYHCGESFKCLPASIEMVGVIGKQFKREHKRCKRSDAGKALEAANVTKHKALLAEDQKTLGLLGPKEGCSMGEKIGFAMEMETLSKCLDGEIPEGLKDDQKFLKAIEDLKASGISISRDK